MPACRKRNGDLVPDIARSRRLPETGEQRVVGRTDRAAGSAYGGDCEKIGGIAGAIEGGRPGTPEWKGRLDDPRRHVRELRSRSRDISRRSRTPLAYAQSSEKRRRRRIE